MQIPADKKSSAMNHGAFVMYAVLATVLNIMRAFLQKHVYVDCTLVWFQYVTYEEGGDDVK